MRKLTITLALLAAVSPQAVAAQDTNSPLAAVAASARQLAEMRHTELIDVQAAPSLASSDSMFAAFRSRYREAVWDLARQMLNRDFNQWLWQDYTDVNARIDSLEAVLGEFGLAIARSEGSIFADVDSRVLLEEFGPHLTGAFRRFLSIRAEEEVEGFSDDAMLLISWETLAGRVATWEAFVVEYPDFVLLNEALGLFSLYLRTYLTGTDNSRIFGWDEPTLLPAVRESYEAFAAQYATTEAGKLVAEYLAVLATSGYRTSDSVRAFLDSRDIRTMLGVQPPVR